jgi:hypothetical protein
MRQLILPDVHNRWELVEKVIKSVKPDKTIILGDYFDDFGDDPHIIADVADWFHHSVSQKDRVHICGNHDVHYWFTSNHGLRCSGFEQFKCVAINDFVTKEDWEKLVFFYNLDNKWLLTHAGFHPSWIDRANFRPSEVLEYSLPRAVSRLENETPDAKRAFYAGKNHWFGMPGFSRSRNSPYYGGLLWCDWNKEFHSVRGLHQIVGHTPDYNITWNVIEEGDTRQKEIPAVLGAYTHVLTDKNSHNLCLDSQPGSKYYAIYENGNLSLHEVPVSDRLPKYDKPPRYS